MREQITASDGSGNVQLCRVDGHENEIILIQKMPACRFLRLRCGRKMDVSVFKIDGSAFENTVCLGILQSSDGQIL